MPGVTSTTASGACSASHPSRAWTRARSSRSSSIGPYSTTAKASPERRTVSAGRSPTAGSDRSTPDAASRRGLSRTSEDGARSVRVTWRFRRRTASARSPSIGTKRTRSPGASWPSFHRSPAATVAGQVKPPRLGPSGPSSTGRVAGEVDGAEGVAGVVDVRRVEPRVAPIGPGPRRLRTVEAHAGAGAVDLHLPLGGEEGVDVAGGEEVGRGVRSLHDADRPVAGETGPSTRADRRRPQARGDVRPDRQHVTGRQHPAPQAAEAAEGERRPAPQHHRHVEPAAHRDVGAQATAAHRAEGRAPARPAPRSAPRAAPVDRRGWRPRRRRRRTPPRRRGARRVGPVAVHSSAAADGRLPTTRLTSRWVRSSIGPLGGTPTIQ